MPRLQPNLKLRREVPESLHTFTGFAVIAAAHRAEQRYAEALEPHGLSTREFLVLAVINQRPQIAASGVAWRLGMSRQRVAEIVRRLDDLGLIARDVIPDNRRQKEIILSAHGREAFAAARGTLAAADAEWQSPLEELHRKALREGLLRLAPNHSAVSWWYMRT